MPPDSCSFDDCSGPVVGRGLCSKHWQRWRRDAMKSDVGILFHGHERHGLQGTTEHVAWSNMIQRCTNTNHPQYPNYGGRGITVCDRWRSFLNFVADMGLKLNPKDTIEREDSNGDYCPENCKWASRVVQNRNTSRNRLITIDGVTKCVAEWAEVMGMQYNVAYKKLIRQYA